MFKIITSYLLKYIAKHLHYFFKISLKKDFKIKHTDFIHTLMEIIFARRNHIFANNILLYILSPSVQTSAYLSI